jgi:hypothetical protein
MRDQHSNTSPQTGKVQGTDDGRVRNGTDLMREKVHSGSYLQKESVELKPEAACLDMGFLGHFWSFV